MSKKLAIMEGDMARKFIGVKYLRTNLQNGKTCDWVPEDEYKLTTKHITKSGTYKAKDEKDKNKKSYYGFSQVTVNVKSSTTGKKDDGNTYSVKTDDQGNITEFVLADTIKVIQPPNKTEYKDGESILTSGMVVKAYRGDGQEWDTDGYPHGVIPNSELSLESSVAKKGEGTNSDEGKSTLDGVSVPFTKGVVVATYTDPTAKGYYAKKRIYTFYGHDFCVAQNLYEADGNFLGYLIIQFTIGMKPVYKDSYMILGNGQERHVIDEWENKAENTTKLGTKYYGAPSSCLGDKYTFSGLPSPVDSVDFDVVIDGVKKYYSANNLVTVNWPRFDDEEILSDTFNITVI